MSKFLAPIHMWLFNKILLMESIEKDILKQIDRVELNAEHHKLMEQVGAFIPDKPLEEIIDQSNIHGWLQDKINRVEIRQAALISKLDSKEALVVLKSYEKAGIQSAKEASTPHTTAKEIYNSLNNFLLEGMPCDRVNQIESESEQSLTWISAKCVHRDNWESQGVSVKKYYAYRAAFTEGFVTAANDAYCYSYSLEEDRQQHQIKLKKGA